VEYLAREYLGPLQISNAIDGMQLGKVLGEDGVVIEAWKHAPAALVEALAEGLPRLFLGQGAGYAAARPQSWGDATVVLKP
jgi:hypothetical protein